MNIPPYPTFPILQGPCMTLRQIKEADMADVLEISFYDSKPASTIAGAWDMQQKIDLDYQNGISIHWGIAHPVTDEIMGSLGYYRGFENGVGEIGCVLRPKYRGQGIMNLSIQLIVGFGLDIMGLNKISATTSLENKPALKLLEKLEFVRGEEREGMVEYGIDARH